MLMISTNQNTICIVLASVSAFVVCVCFFCCFFFCCMSHISFKFIIRYYHSVLSLVPTGIWEREFGT